MSLTSADLPAYWDSGAPFKARGNESLFSVHVRARQMIRKLGRRDTEVYPRGLEFRFIKQKVSSLRQSIAHTHGDRVIEMIGHVWEHKSIIGVERDQHVLEYKYLMPITDDDDGLIHIL